MTELIVIAIGSYLVGSIPWGVMLSRRRGVDITHVGSGNIGATNVARALGKRLGILVLILDALKGVGPTLLIYYQPLSHLDPTWLFAVVTCGPIVGHCFPVWLKFRGGKGVATSLGVFITVDPIAAAMCLGVFVAVYFLSRAASLASMLSSLAMAPALWLLGHSHGQAWVAFGLALLIVARHRQNIRRLLSRSELKV